MKVMTLINQDAVARREAARENGRFGEQHHTAPELTLTAITPATLQNSWDERQATAREVQAATVNRAIAHMPENIRGLRFIERDGELIVALVIPSEPGGHIAGSDFHENHRPVIAAYANDRSDYVELEPVYEKSGREAWDWVPSPEQRAIPASFADTAREDALRRFREANHDFTQQAATYLRAAIPEGVDSIEVAYAPVKGAKGYETVPTVVGAYDENGELVMFDVNSSEFADYRVNVARTAVQDVFPAHYTETNAAVYTISREQG